MFSFKQQSVILIDENINNENDVFGASILKYSASICAHTTQTINLYCDINTSKPYQIDICFKLYFRDIDNELVCKDVLIATVSYKTNNVHLQLIEVPEQLRHQGLGILIFESFIKLIEEISIKNHLCIKKIQGSLGNGSNFTPKYAKKLYKHFHRYSYLEDKHLYLNKKHFKKNIIEYIIK